MYTVDLYLRVRLACHVDGLSQREAASRFGIARETVRKMLRHSEPPGYRLRQPPKRPKLAPFTDIIDRILEEDRTVHRKQHHTAKRIFERLRDEHGFTGKETIVKDYVRERRLRRREMFVPLSHPPGHAQADFGEADAIIAGVKYRAHFFVMTLPHSDACFVAAYPAATTEAWLDGHNRAFVFFGGVPQSILYDNDKCLVSRILSDGTRQRTRAFSGLQSHYLFEDRYGRPGKGNDKGNVEGVVGYARRNFMTPLPRFASWDAFNGHLEEQCRNRQGNVLRGHRESIGERFVRDREALKRPLPAPFDACDKQGTRVNSLSLVRYRTNDYSVPVAYGHQEVWIRGYVHEVVIGCGAGIIARHLRSYDREDMVFDPIHYLPLLEHKIGALDQAAPLERVRHRQNQKGDSQGSQKVIQAMSWVKGGQPWMTRPYSEDLRERVVRVVESGTSRNAAAKQFDVSISFVVKLMQRWKQRGTIKADKYGGWKKSKLAPHGDRIRALVMENCDITIDELCVLLAAEGIEAKRSTLGDFLLAQGLSRKKRQPTPPSRSALTSRRREPLGATSNLG